MSYKWPDVSLLWPNRRRERTWEKLFINPDFNVSVSSHSKPNLFFNHSLPLRKKVFFCMVIKVTTPLRYVSVSIRCASSQDNKLLWNKMPAEKAFFQSLSTSQKCQSLLLKLQCLTRRRSDGSLEDETNNFFSKLWRQYLKYRFL